MAGSLLLSGLLTKHRELLGLVEFHHKEAQRLTTDAAHVAAVVKMIDPEIDTGAHLPKIYKPRLSPFKSGDLPRLILDILREATAPLSTTEIANEAVKCRGINAEELDGYVKKVKPVHSTLQRLRRRGLVEPVGTYGGRGTGALLWRLT
ncbi:MAG: hypothetical protein FWD62_15420 [Betaproteobacteria bacterium]|nr:hypothetical protein [Betaproteobacteria bacterium]